MSGKQYKKNNKKVQWEKYAPENEHKWRNQFGKTLNTFGGYHLRRSSHSFPLCTHDAVNDKELTKMLMGFLSIYACVVSLLKYYVMDLSMGEAHVETKDIDNEFSFVVI